MITAFNTKNQFYYYLVQKKKDAILASFGYKKSPSSMGFGSIKL